MSIYFASDHRGLELKNYLIENLKQNYNCLSTKLVNFDTDDYPDFAFDVCTNMSKEEDVAILICGTGIGISIAANKVKGIRCARIVNEEDALTCKKHNHANAVALSADLNKEKALEMIKTFLNSEPSNEDRHVRRVNKIINYEDGKYNML